LQAKVWINTLGSKSTTLAIVRKQREVLMSEVSWNDIGPSLKTLLVSLRPGEELGVLEDGKRLATIRKEGPPNIPVHPCRAGSAQQTIHWMSDDFDAALDDFREYMQ
jgi:hypothetical protein